MAVLTLEALSMELPAMREKHPNRVPFTGVLTRLEEPSDRSPHGAQHHRVMLTKAAAEQALWSLIGMAVNFDAQTQRGHMAKAKVGIITSAHVQGSDLVVAGYLFGKDFPTEVLAIQAGSREQRLGMSFEITNVQVQNPLADIWCIERCLFTGAAILERNAAAYGNTSIAAQAAGKDPMTMEKVLAFDDVLASLRTQRDQLAALLATDAPTIAAAEKATVPPKGQEKKANRRTVMCNMANSIMKRLASESGDEHDDEEQDTKLFKRLMQQMMGMGVEAEGGETSDPLAAMASDPMLAVLQAMDGDSKEDDPMSTVFMFQMAQQQKDMQKQVQQLSAAMEAMGKLLTDTVTQQTGLITDMTTQVKGLLTDMASVKAAAEEKPAAVAEETPAAPAAPAAPAPAVQAQADAPLRKTFSNGQINWAEKLDLAAGTKYTESQIDQVLKTVGMTDAEQRMAAKMELMNQGVMK